MWSKGQIWDLWLDIPIRKCQYFLGIHAIFHVSSQSPKLRGMDTQSYESQCKGLCKLINTTSILHTYTRQMCDKYSLPNVTNALTDLMECMK